MELADLSYQIHHVCKHIAMKLKDGASDIDRNIWSQLRVKEMDIQYIEREIMDDESVFQDLPWMQLIQSLLIIAGLFLITPIFLDVIKHISMLKFALQYPLFKIFINRFIRV